MGETKEIEAVIGRILRDHPLTELETGMLAVYVTDAVLTVANYAEYVAIVRWLEGTGRISPREQRELLSLV